MKLDKFNDAEALEQSYFSLEREFTKKCQELARVKKELELASNSKVEDAEVQEDFVTPENESQEPAPIVTQVVEQEPATLIEPVEAQAPTEDLKQVNFNLDFRARAGEFLQKTQDAKKYAKEMAKILLADKSLLNCADPFAVAYALAVQREKKDEVKEKNVISEESSPVEVVPNVSILTSSIQGAAPRGAKKRCSTLSEAGEEILKRYFN